MNNAGNFDSFVEAVEAAKDLKIMRTIRRDYLSGRISLIQLLSGTVSNSLALSVLQTAMSNGIDVESFMQQIERESYNDDDQILGIIKKSLINNVELRR